VRDPERDRRSGSPAGYLPAFLPWPYQVSPWSGLLPSDDGFTVNVTGCGRPRQPSGPSWTPPTSSALPGMPTTFVTGLIVTWVGPVSASLGSENV
jgi:hypothetical protein